MDANGLRFWQLADPAHWPHRAQVGWDEDCRVLHLESVRRLDAPVDASRFATANSALEVVPRTVDAHQAVARWDSAAGAIVVRSHLPGEAVRMALAQAPSDICLGANGVLYITQADRIVLHDLRGRWADTAVQLGAFTPWRLTADAGGAWVLERDSGRLARLTGLPLADNIPRSEDYAPGVFRPAPENCDPPTLRVLPDIAWPAGERPIALATHPEAGLGLLSWFDDGEARLRRLDAGREVLGPPLALRDARYAYALAWLDKSRIAVRMPGRRDAPAFTVNDAAEALPLGAVYPLARDALEAPFAHRLDGPPRYPLGEAQAEPLLPLSIENRARRGAAASFTRTTDRPRAHLIDSGSATTVWHRLYAEASIPPACGFVVWLAATDEPQPPADDAALAWHAHGFGREIADLAPEAMLPHVPRAAWDRSASELPHHPGLAHWTLERDRRGLFNVLIQNARSRVRQVVGRYLWMRIELFGDGRSGPQIAALRAYAGRFDYGERYLPRLYREIVFGAAADAPGERIAQLETAYVDALDAGGTPAEPLAAQLAATAARTAAPVISVEQPGRRWRVSDRAGQAMYRLVHESQTIGIYRPRATQADFLSRFLANFEGVLTTLEDRIACAYLLTDPEVTPHAHLDWLAGWIGVAFEPALPVERRRAWLRAAPQLARMHGTYRGLASALDIASGGGVRGGEIVVLEDFRLRRLLATLLGVDLADDDDPLLPGLRASGNSIVGDTLVLSDTETVELLALFREDVADAAENAQVLAFLERLAHRATVLVHQSVSPQDLGLIRRVVAAEAPAHVEVRVATATWPFLVGVASLVGVDTYLGPPQRVRPARLGVSALGMGDYVLGRVTLDPRLAGDAAPAPSTPPVANAGTDRVAPFGTSFTLDGSASRAAPNRRIEQYVWRRLPPLS